MRCPHCHTDNDPSEDICRFCHTPLPDPNSRLQPTVPVSGVSVGDTGFEQGRLIANRYLVERELGRGGMGVVYLVRDQQLRGKEVALKLISAELTSSSQGRDRFIQEVLAAQELQHSNIIRVFHLDEMAGQFFFTMEHVPGRNLRELVQDRKKTREAFTLKECAAVLVPVLKALEHAHTRPSPVVHRDIKPENIMVVGDLSNPRIMVLDFGLAKVLSPSRLTSTAMAMGTAYYMAPEQVNSARDIDQRADLFSVGVILYEMLTLDVPSGFFNMPTELNESLPPAVDDLIRQTLQQSPVKRYASAREFRHALEALEGDSGGETSRSAQVDQIGTARKTPVQRVGSSASRLVLMLLTVSVILGLALFFMTRGNEGPALPNPVQSSGPEVQPPPDEISSPARFALTILTEPLDTTVEFLNASMTYSPGMNVEAGTYAVRVRHDGFETQTLNVTVMDSDFISERIALREVPAPATSELKVSTNPPGATVLVNGEAQADLTPLTLTGLEPGDHVVTVRLAGHAESSASVVVPSEAQTLDLALDLTPLGRLFVEVKPENARIVILPIRDRFEQGMQLNPGSYDLRISASGYVERREQVDVQGGGETRVAYELTPDAGMLRVESSVEGVQVTLAGNVLGTAPGLFSDIPSGQHAVLVTRDGYHQWSGEVVVRSGETATIAPSMKSIIPEPGETWTDPVTGMVFVWVPAGKFMMGSNDGKPDEQPVHEVTLTKGFWIGKFEVTQKQWKAIMGKNPSQFPGDDRPVEFVSWDACQEFIRELNSRSIGARFALPTEAQWEYAARYGNMNAKYAGGNDVGRIAWHIANSGRQTRPVGSLSPNSLGLHDMSGNVWEWCEDVHVPYTESPKTDPRHPTGGSARINRGGSVISSPEDVRATKRTWDAPVSYGRSLGLRLVRVQ